MVDNLVKVCKSSDEAKVQRKIFLVLTEENPSPLWKLDDFVEITPSFEKKITKAVLKEINPIDEEEYCLDCIKEVFQKLKDTLLEKGCIENGVTPEELDYLKNAIQIAQVDDREFFGKDVNQDFSKALLRKLEMLK